MAKRLVETKMKKTKIAPKKVQLSELEESQLFAAMSRTWQVIGYDAEVAGVKTAAHALEVVMDCDYISTYGKLDQAVLDKLNEADYKQVDKFLLANKSRWY